MLNSGHTSSTRRCKASASEAQHVASSIQPTEPRQHRHLSKPFSVSRILRPPTAVSRLKLPFFGDEEEECMGRMANRKREGAIYCR
ncbi:hypothetical protein BKA70DRAFT_1566412 [Coprinopsis sp. MPI-PUGE-AT-0042]|nr:hypothetical protein BKA70DRAFT_1566412 [Coprinopsis sp. MPI-PUGE-AT-0042]